MDAKQIRLRVPKTPFRVLIIGRANAGKTSILQRVCETTDSPIIYRKGEVGREEVCDPSIFCGSDLTANQVKLDPTVNVSNYFRWLRLLLVNNGASGASTRSTMNLCSPTIRVMSFTIPRESSRVALMNSRSWKISFDASAEKRNCKTDCMRYGSCYGFHDYDNRRSCFEVLHPNGQPPTRARSQILRQDLLWPEWCAVTSIYDYR